MRRIPQEGSLTDLLTLNRKDIFLNLNCHAIGTVKSFDSVSQTCTITINYCKTYEDKNEKGIYYDKAVDYPTLTQCPIISLSGGASGVSFPIVAGDQCMILFNDRDIDNWFSGARSGHVISSRAHAMADGIAIVGLHPKDMPISNYDTTRALLYNGLTSVGVSSTKVRIKNSTNNLNTELQALVTEIKDLVTQIALITCPVVALGSPTGVPNNAAAITAISTRLTTTATNIGSLLE